MLTRQPQLQQPISLIYSIMGGCWPRTFFSTLVPGGGSFQTPDLAGLGYGLGLGFCVVFTIIVSLIVTIILITILTVILA